MAALVIAGVLLTLCLVGLWGLWPLWGRPIDPGSEPPVPMAAIAGKTSVEPRPRRRALTSGERTRVAIGAVAIALALGASFLIVRAYQEINAAIGGMHE